MKRTELKRKTPLKAYKSLKRSALRKTRKARRTRINVEKRAKKAEESAQMQALRAAVLARDGHVCRLCVAAREGKFITDRPHPDLRYQNAKLEIHHIHGRLGSLLLDKDHCITLCTWHHLYSRFGPHNGRREFEKLLPQIRKDDGNA